ncbi:MAG: four helix bundle protein [Candidatus Acidiferrales bacterium]
MQRFTNLLVWQRSHALALAVYRLTAKFPGDEKFGLTSQLRRAALSVPTNIAEGSKRISRQDYARFLNMAEGSLAEAEYLLMVSRDLGYATAQEIESHQKEATEIASMLSSLRAKVLRMK